MLKEERQERILALLAERKFVQVEPLGRALCVSLPTVRRDLAELAQEGRLLRRRGGAQLPPDAAVDGAGETVRTGTDQGVGNFETVGRVKENSAVVGRLCESRNEADRRYGLGREDSMSADALLPDGWPEAGETVFLDEGGATFLLAGGSLPPLTAVTNAPGILESLCRAGVRVFCTGGEMLASGRLAGSGALETVQTFRFDRAVIAAGEENGEVLGTGPEEAALYRTVWERSRRRVLLRQPPGDAQWRYRIAQEDTADTVIDAAVPERTEKKGADNG